MRVLVALEEWSGWRQNQESVRWLNLTLRVEVNFTDVVNSVPQFRYESLPVAFFREVGDLGVGQ
jgi:hypothetical protein